MIRKYVIVIALITAYLLDAAVFGAIGLYSIRPDALLAAMVSLGVLLGWAPSAVIGVVLGALMDITLNKYLGLSSLALLGAAVAGGVFHEKFYADNAIVPTVTAAAAMLVKEHIMLITVFVSGGNIGSYIIILAAHIIPASLMTGGLCALMHLVLKRTLYKKTWLTGLER